MLHVIGALLNEFVHFVLVRDCFVDFKIPLDNLFETFISAVA